MSLRDYFAGQALLGFFSDPLYIQQAGENAEKRNISPDDYLAIAAYNMADVMLNERAKQTA